MTTYYNEFDPKAAAWLRELIKRDLIAPGDVDERSIKDVKADDLKGYTQCHFFAGIGGWSYALRLAGWADDVPVWTGSCPCQPFSQAGRRKGTADERHLWPEFCRLIQQRNPATVFGEQVAGQAGRDWLTGVFSDLEAIGYSAAGADLCAAGIGAPHIRQRLYWVAHAGCVTAGSEQESRDTQAAGERVHIAGRGSIGGMADTRCGQSRSRYSRAGKLEKEKRSEQVINATTNSVDGGMANTSCIRQGRATDNQEVQTAQHTIASVEPTSGFANSTIIECRDGKCRRIPVEPKFYPLAHGLSARVVRIRGYGNAIVPSLASQFIQASLEAIQETQ